MTLRAQIESILIEHVKGIVAFLALAFFSLANAAQQDGREAPSQGSSRRTSLKITEASLGKAHRHIHPWSLAVSPDGRRLAYVTGEMIGKPHNVVVDGVESPAYAWAGGLAFSSDSKRVAYVAGQGKDLSGGGGYPVGRRRGAGELFSEGMTVVVDGVAGPTYACSGPPVFSPDSRRVAHAACRGERSFIVIDGMEGKSYDLVTNPAFSPDSQRVAYLAWNFQDAFLVNGAQVTSTGTTGAGDTAFSPDGRRLAYKVNRGKQFFMVVDGVEGPPFDRIGFPGFSPDSRRFAYAARRGKTAFTVIEGTDVKEHAQYRQVGDPVFSPDGRRVAYWADDGKKERVVVDDIAGTPYDEIGKLVFGPDGRHLAFEARLGSKWLLVVDGVEGPEYMPVEKKIPIERESRQVLRRGWVFERPDLVRYVGVRKDEIVRWEVQITQAGASRP